MRLQSSIGLTEAMSESSRGDCLVPPVSGGNRPVGEPIVGRLMERLGPAHNGLQNPETPYCSVR